MEFEQCPTGIAVLGYLWSRYPGAVIGVFAATVVVPIFITLLMLTIDEACQSKRRRWNHRQEMRHIAVSHGYVHGEASRRRELSRRPWSPEDEERWRNQLCLPPSYEESTHHSQRHPIEGDSHVTSNREESTRDDANDSSAPGVGINQDLPNGSTEEEEEVMERSTGEVARVDDDSNGLNRSGREAGRSSIRRIEAVAERLNELGVESRPTSDDGSTFNLDTDAPGSLEECMATIATSIEPLHATYEPTTARTTVKLPPSILRISNVSVHYQ